MIAPNLSACSSWVFMGCVCRGAGGLYFSVWPCSVPRIPRRLEASLDTMDEVIQRAGVSFSNVSLKVYTQLLYPLVIQPECAWAEAPSLLGLHVALRQYVFAFLDAYSLCQLSLCSLSLQPSCKAPPLWGRLFRAGTSSWPLQAVTAGKFSLAFLYLATSMPFAVC